MSTRNPPSKLVEDKEAIVMRLVTFTDLQKRLEALLSASAASVILTEVGKECGRRSATRMKEKHKISGADLIEAIAKLKSEEAWGEFDFRGINLEQKQGSIIVKDCFESRGYGHATAPICHFVRGYLSGVLNVVFEQDVVLDEVACLAKGDRHCEFRVRPGAGLV